MSHLRPATKPCKIIIYNHLQLDGRGSRLTKKYICLLDDHFTDVAVNPTDFIRLTKHIIETEKKNKSLRLIFKYQLKRTQGISERKKCKINLYNNKLFFFNWVK